MPPLGIEGPQWGSRTPCDRELVQIRPGLAATGGRRHVHPRPVDRLLLMTTLAATAARAGSWLVDRRRVRPARAGLAIVGAALLVLLALYGPGTDATSYWSFDLAHPYTAATLSLTGTDAFRYAPPLAYAFLPFHVLSFTAFRVVWMAIEFACLAALVGWRWALALVAMYPVTLELSSGNIHLLMALAVAIGFRYPAAWSFLILTKVTPGIGLLWFAVRRQWRDLAIALGVTLIIAAVSFALSPHLWQQWWVMLGADLSLNMIGDHPYIPIPLWLRLPAAVLVVVWGALHDRPWTVAVAVTLALPTIWVQSLPVLLGAVPSLIGRPAFKARPHHAASSPTGDRSLAV